MPVDSRNKRASMMSAAVAIVPRLPLADGSLASAPDRAQLGLRYRLADDAGGGGSPPTTGPTRLVPVLRRRRR